MFGLLLSISVLLIVSVLASFSLFDRIFIDAFVGFASVVAVKDFGCDFNLGIFL